MHTHKYHPVLGWGWQLPGTAPESGAGGGPSGGGTEGAGKQAPFGLKSLPQQRKPPTFTPGKKQRLPPAFTPGRLGGTTQAASPRGLPGPPEPSAASGGEAELDEAGAGSPGPLRAAPTAEAMLPAGDGSLIAAALA